MEQKFNLDAAAIPDGDAGSDTSSEGSQPEQKVEETEESTESNATVEAEESEEDTTVDEARVPYSRFKTVREEKETAVERAIRAEAELEVYKRTQSQNQSAPSGDLPDYWVELYGDSDMSKRAWGAEQKRLAAIEERLSNQAVEAVEKRQLESEKRVQETVDSMVDAFADYGANHKRTFNDAEQSAILDIMDELSPKDEAGRYEIDPTVFLDKAVELHDLRQFKVTGKTRQAKQNVANLAGASSDNTQGSGDKTTHFRAGNWDSWRENPLLPKE